jgi:hypothetical protein
MSSISSYRIIAWAGCRDTNRHSSPLPKGARLSVGEHPSGDEEKYEVCVRCSDGSASPCGESSV